MLDLIFLILMTLWAYDRAVIFGAIIAGNAVGAIGGLLFAVPRRDKDAKRLAISGNTSLEDVSDWLTKTIIGAGLVSWSSILARLDQSGSFVGMALASYEQENVIAGGVAIILASSALGAIIGYLWFARHWPSELAGADKATIDILSKIAAAGQKQAFDDVAPPVPNVPPPPPPQPPGPPTGGDGRPPPGGDGGGEGKPPPGGDGGGDGKPPVSEGKPADGGLADNEPAAPDHADRVTDTALLPMAPKARHAEESLRSNQESLRTAVFDKYARMRAAPLVREDWAKGMFGGKSVRQTKFGERKLSAAVKPIGDEWFEVSLSVEAGSAPETDAIFFLHNTFSQPTPTVGFDENHVARLTVSAWGSFTVGVLMDDGTTELELDLSQVENAPVLFRYR